MKESSKFSTDKPNQREICPEYLMCLVGYSQVHLSLQRGLGVPEVQDDRGGQWDQLSQPDHVHQENPERKRENVIIKM